MAQLLHATVGGKCVSLASTCGLQRKGWTSDVTVQSVACEAGVEGKEEKKVKGAEEVR